jgi:hypothetical protein
MTPHHAPLTVAQQPLMPRSSRSTALGDRCRLAGKSIRRPSLPPDLP